MNQTILDKIDSRLLALLQVDGRMSNAKMAHEVGLSPPACLRRVQRLEKSGIIEGFTVRLNAQAVGKQQTVFVEVTLDRQHEAAMEAFERAVVAVPEVQECHAVAADFDFLLRVEVDSTVAYERLRRRELAALPHLQRMRSVFGLRSVKRQIGPLFHL